VKISENQKILLHVIIKFEEKSQKIVIGFKWFKDSRKNSRASYRESSSGKGLAHFLPLETLAPFK